MRRILVTGASTWTGGGLVSELEQRDGVEVFGVDEVPQRRAFSSPFLQLDMNRTELATHVLELEPDTVVHLLTIDRAAELGKSRAHEQAVVGVQALFGAIGRSTSVRRVIVKSDTAIYAAGPRSPSVFAEDTTSRGHLSRYGHEIADLESLVEQLVPIHEHVSYVVLRLAPIIGATIGNPLSRFLLRPVVPTRLGFDPRLSLLHEADAVGVFAHAVDEGPPGIFNVAAGGPAYLSRVLRLGRRYGQPLPRRGYEAALRGLARAGQPFPGHVAGLLENGTVVDTTRMAETLGFIPRRSTRGTVLATYSKEAGT